MLKEKQLKLLRTDKEFELVDHFLGAPTIGATQTNQYFPSNIGWYINTNGSGSGAAASAGGATNPGIITLQTGIVAGTSRSALTTFPSTGFTPVAILGSAAIELEMILKFVPSNSSQDKEEWIGFIDSVSAAPTGAGADAYIYFDYNTNSAQWQYIYKPIGSSGTVVASGFVADSNWFRLNIRFSKSPVKVTFSINGAYSYTAPVTFADGGGVGIGALTKKYAGMVSQGLDIDFVRLSYNAS